MYGGATYLQYKSEHQISFLSYAITYVHMLNEALRCFQWLRILCNGQAPFPSAIYLPFCYLCMKECFGHTSAQSLVQKKTSEILHANLCLKSLWLDFAVSAIYRFVVSVIWHIFYLATT